MDYFLFVIILIGGVAVQCLTGFGFGVFVSCFLPLLLPMHISVAVLALLSIVINGQIFWSLRSHVHLRAVLPTVASCLVGQSIGISILFSADELMLKRGMGCVLLFLAAFFAFVKGRLRLKASLPNGICIGIFAGLLNTFNIAGPLIAAYYYFACDNNETYTANLQATFLLTSIYNLLLHLLYGNLTPTVIGFSALGIIVLLPTVWIGRYFTKNMQKKTVGTLIYSFVALMGLLQIITASR